MNERSVEYGLIINGYGSCRYKDLMAVCDKIEDDIAYFDCPAAPKVGTNAEPETMPVEGDGEHNHFISFGHLKHGKVFPQIPYGAKVIQRKLQTLIKPCAVIWGVIETWR